MLSLYMNNVIIVMVLSVIIGISIQNVIINDISEMKWIKRYNMENLMIVLITVLNNNIILILSSLSLLMVSNRLVIIHWLLILINSILLSSNNMFTMILLIITIDIISILNIIMVKDSIGEGIWYYLLYQSIITILLWYLISMNLMMMVGVLYYYKLGAGIGGYYIPNLYYYIICKNVYLLIYIGITNIILMYNPCFMLSYFCSDCLSFQYYIIMLNMMLVIYIMNNWIISGNLFINNWLYMISVSTIVLSNVFNVLIYVSVIDYNLSYYIFYFTLTSIIVWYMLLYSLIISL